MFDRKKLINALGHLSNRLFELSSSQNNDFFVEARNQNFWFTPEFIENSFRAIAGAITKDKIYTFCNQYDYPLPGSPKAVGLVMAGNIPLSGFFDVVMTLLSGNKALLQLSSTDPILPKFVIRELIKIYPELEHSILIKDNLKKIDAIIATGSNNSAMYFNYYFSHIPHLIRKNRCSVAVISADSLKNPEKNAGLAEDILLYFGLGCRSISKLYCIGMEKENKFSEYIFNLVEPYWYLSNHPKYANNYLYQKTLLIMNNIKHNDNGFLLLVPEKKTGSPVSVCHYEYFKSENEVLKEMEANRNSIQCIVSQYGHFPGSISFGKAQQPELWDFADGVNVMEFLGNL